MPFFIKLLSYLSENKFPCPKPIANKNNEKINRIKNKNAALVTFLNGQSKNKITSEECFEIGKITANTWRELNDSKSLITGFVAEIDSTVCGIAHCFLRPSTWHKVGYLYLEDLFVDPKYRGAGVGRVLLDKAAEYGREIGAEKLYWITKEDNAQARALYDSFVKGSATGFIQYEYSL